MRSASQRIFVQQPGRRSAPSLSRKDRNIRQKPQIYEGLCRSLAPRGICATGRCTIAVGAQRKLLDAIKSPAEREWYARQAIQSGWSRNVLVHQIENGLFARQCGGPIARGRIPLSTDCRFRKVSDIPRIDLQHSNHLTQRPSH
jgi:uncharacterized protein DUF1016